MTFTSSLITAVLVSASLPLAACLQLDINNGASIKTASADLAFGLMSWYHNNATGMASTAVGVFPEPLYWWEAGAVWGAMIDNWAYTGDRSYIPTITQGLLAQTGPENNFMPPAYFSSLGNDDQAFWALASLSALEYDFPIPEGKASTIWLDLSRAVFDSMVPRWDTTSCNGGLRWQIFPANAGYDYKNTISNAAFFQIAARLARYTGDTTYVNWAEKAWDWMINIGLISTPDYFVFDGTDPKINCSAIEHTAWSYNPAMLLYGTANMYNLTNGSPVWADRTTGLLTYIEKFFFSPYQNATNIMFEFACEPTGVCNNDQVSFKAYLARWMAKSAILMPTISDKVNRLLAASAVAAARSCSGGDNKQTCGQKWYTGGYDGAYGVGQQLSALETVQSLLLLANPQAPLREARVVVNNPTTTSTPPSTPIVPATLPPPSTSILPATTSPLPHSTISTSTTPVPQTPTLRPSTSSTTSIQRALPTQPAVASPGINGSSRITAYDTRLMTSWTFLITIILAFVFVDDGCGILQ